MSQRQWARAMQNVEAKRVWSSAQVESSSGRRSAQQRSDLPREIRHSYGRGSDRGSQPGEFLVFVSHFL